jgi:hypothetical protein
MELILPTNDAAELMCANSVIDSVENLLLQFGGEVDPRVALLGLTVMRVREQGHLARRRVGWNLESTGVLGISPRLGSGHNVVLVGRRDHAKMTALSALRRSNGHGTLVEFLAQIRDCSAGGLAGDLGDRVSRESKGGRGRCCRHDGSSAGDAFSCSSPCAQNWQESCGGKK